MGSNDQRRDEDEDRLASSGQEQNADRAADDAAEGGDTIAGAGGGRDARAAQEAGREGRLSSGSAHDVDGGAGSSAYTGNTGGSGGSHGASTENRGNAGLTVGSGGGPTEGTLDGDPPQRQTSDMTTGTAETTGGTSGSLGDGPSVATGNTGLHGGGTDQDALSVGTAPERGSPGPRKSS